MYTVSIPSYLSICLILNSVGSLDWQFSNVTADSTYQFVGPWSELNDGEETPEKNVFEMRGMQPMGT
jgi:hypothetical protein